MALQKKNTWKSLFYRVTDGALTNHSSRWATLEH